MKCRPKPNGTQKHHLNAPQRRSLGYWIHIAFFAFFIPLVFITIGTTLLLNAIAPQFILLGFPISLLIALYIARKAHHQMLSLNDKEYEKRFNLPPVVENQNTYPRDSGCSYDRASSTYWIFGPGSSGYKDKF